jgi:glycosyltransferase involved in cell wall biosynthesis
VLFIDKNKSNLNYLKAALTVFWNAQIRHRYQIIHAHYGFYCALTARMQWRIPVVVTFRGSDVMWERERPISRFVANHSYQSIVMTDEMKQQLGREDALIIPYGIDLEMFKPVPQADARRKLNLPPDAPLILFPYDPGRSLKRFDLVEQAAEILKAEFPDVQVLAVHNEPHENIAAYMNACDVMVLTSKREGAPVAIREAMACNMPIVSVDVGDVAEVINGTEGCYLVKHDAADIAEKLAWVLRSRQRTNGRLAAQKMSLDQSAAQVAAIYTDIVQSLYKTAPATKASSSNQ